MQSSRYYPFERNRYFFGKLLTVRDFAAEQKYFIDKRRMLNRLLHGSGIVSGLQVVKVDDKTVSVGMGVAIDDAGREIVIATPQTVKLANTEGFSNNEYAKNVYLCLRYDENLKEPVNPVIASNTNADDLNEYNRISETGKVFFREQAPDPRSFEFTNLMYVTSVLYNDLQVRVLLQTPRYVQVNDTFAATIRIEKTLQTPRVTLDFQVDATASAPLASVEKDAFSFAEPGDGKVAHYDLPLLLTAGSTPDLQGKLTFIAGTAKISIGDKQFDLQPDADNVVTVVADSVRDRIWQDYFERSLDVATATSEDSCIYLAKINLTQVGPTYMIEQVEPVPFGEYVYNSTLLMKLGEMSDAAKAAVPPTITVTSSADVLPPDAKPQLSVDYDVAKQQFDFKLGIPQAKPAPETHKMTMGVAEITLESQFKPGLHLFGKPVRSFFSDEIDHGLGEGDVFVVTGVENSSANVVSEILNTSDRVYFGQTDVFDESEFEPDMPNVTVGTVVFPKKGTFRIGIKLQEPTDIGKIRIHWWAYKSLIDQTNVEQTQQEAAAGNQEQE